MVGTKYMSVRDGAATVIAIHGCREWVIQWDDTGHISVAQADATKKGCIHDGSKNGARQLPGRIARDAVRVAAAYAAIQQDIVKSAALVIKRAASVARIAAEKIVAKEVAKDAAIVHRNLRQIEKEQTRVASGIKRAADAIQYKINRDAAYVQSIHEQSLTWQMDESSPRKNIVDIDFKTRGGWWVLHFGGHGESLSSRLGKLHNNMTSRAAKGGSVQEKYAPTYKGVIVSELFLNPQTFSDWAVQQPGWGLGWHLEKDLLCTGVRQYSEHNCVFLPRLLNMAIIAKNGCKIKLRKLAEFYKPNLDVRAYAKLIELSE